MLASKRINMSLLKETLIAKELFLCAREMMKKASHGKISWVEFLEEK